MPGPFDDDFLLETEAARRLHHEHAAPQPIFDYHCHLEPQKHSVLRSRSRYAPGRGRGARGGERGCSNPVWCS
nr:MAG: hypothetical protein DIU78_01560 [Pseudomonadota bacterium]